VPDLKSIPDDIKWRLAADCAARLPVMYDVAFRKVLGEKFDEIEQDIWIELSRRAFTIAQELSLPLKGAHDLAESMHIVMTILFGPEFRCETIDVSEDGSVIIIKRCPLLSVAQETGSHGEHTFPKCMALTLTTIPALKKDYSARYVRSMCTGDRQCEIKISPEKKPEITESGKGKKR
jgi:predicted ArsR family transcriptional regulator